MIASVAGESSISGQTCTMWVLGKTIGIQLVSLAARMILLSRVVEASIKGQSTFGMEGTDGEKMEKLQIVEAASALR